ncbi:MAG: CerR family C-terminal domain-containing protein [Deltaproteobacteria bacterium]|nr:CerR family C-terminal domain-containing protein [Deltaproteobacteria bacterium]
MTAPKRAMPTAQKRILQAAMEVFSDSGFYKATVRDICLKASVNVAAIHYYFGSKEKLYEAVVKQSLGLSETGAEQLKAFGEGQGPEQALAGFIRTFLFEILDQSKTVYGGKLMAWELNQPTDAFDMIISDIIRPNHERLCAIVASLLGAGAGDDLVKKCVFSIVGQCLHYRYGRPVIAQLHPAQGFDAGSFDTIAEHITRFSLGALRQIADEMNHEE